MKANQVSMTGIGPNASATTAKASPSPDNRWSAVKRVRLPHRPGLPLSSSSGGDLINDGGGVGRERDSE
ncbi:hypothetical protein [Rhizobacter sp. Root1221]|jgi:hypothetical protein|uniref:hypothetical protein n=1 Tax=Rhizobacter sp. Root1221 TaxID=1736433 RepID=UPI000712C4EE|nr:hypothetical protein [Rhizobacter sp. Root1221]KQV92822.1 hypothetical protein ASC87_27545 [Rhizobacter sp. Root1221]